MKIKKSLIILSTIGILGSSSILPLASCGQVTPDPVIEYYEVKPSDVTFSEGSETTIIDIRSDLTEKNLLFSRNAFTNGIYEFEWTNEDNVKNRFESFKLSAGIGVEEDPDNKSYSFRFNQKSFSILGLRELYFSQVAPSNISSATGSYDSYSNMMVESIAALENISQKLTFDFNLDENDIYVSGGNVLPFYSTSTLLPKQIFVTNTKSLERWSEKLGINYSQHKDIFHFLP